MRAFLSLALLEPMYGIPIKEYMYDLRVIDYLN